MREEAERIEGKLRFLANQTDLSSVTISIREVKDFVPEGPPTLGKQIGRSFGGSMDGLQAMATGILLFAVALIPWAVPLGFLGWIVTRVLRRKKG